MLDIETLNEVPHAEFVALLQGIFEHSPWVAERAAARRPFASCEHLLDAMRGVVDTASDAEQMALINAHPHLGARGRNKAALTEASAREQQRAGLDACSDEEFAELLCLNTLYVEKFSFPFILAVRGHNPHSILANFKSRLNNVADIERRAALAQIGLIAGYRLAELIT